MQNVYYTSSTNLYSRRNGTVIFTLIMIMLGSISAALLCPLDVGLLSRTAAGNQANSDVSNIKMSDNYNFIIFQQTARKRRKRRGREKICNLDFVGMTKIL